MKYILIIMTLFIIKPVEASDIIAYACDTCDSQGSQVLAKSYAPLANCNFTNPPGTVATPDDVDCNGNPAELIVVNPLTQQAFKYRVQQMCQGNYCDPDINLVQMNLTADELNIMATYYDIDSTMRSSIGQVSGLMALSLSNEFLFTTNSAVGQCSENPMDYFTNPTTQKNIEREIATRIASKVGHKSWSQYITTSYVGVSTFQIGWGVSTVTYDQKHISQPVYERYFFGTDNNFRSNNNLNFRVNYVGNIIDQPGISTFGLQLILDRSTSWVDGYRLSNLTPSGGNVNLTTSLESMPCFTEFLESQPSEITGPATGSGGGTGDIGGGDPLLPSDGSPEWELCPSDITATTCSITENGSSQCTITIIRSLKPC